MIRDINKTRTRKEFVTLCMNKPELGAEHLKKVAMNLSKCKKTSDVVRVLSNLLYLTERTIYLDCIPSNKRDDT